jgi:hypothetical protein
VSYFSFEIAQKKHVQAAFPGKNNVQLQVEAIEPKSLVHVCRVPGPRSVVQRRSSGGCLTMYELIKQRHVLLVLTETILVGANVWDKKIIASY